MDVSVVGNLKDKFLKDFNKFMQQLYKGTIPNYTLLIQEITVIENEDYFDNTIYEYLMTTTYE